MNAPILLFGMPRSGMSCVGKPFDYHPDTMYHHKPYSVNHGDICIDPIVMIRSKFKFTNLVWKLQIGNFKFANEHASITCYCSALKNLSGSVERWRNGLTLQINERMNQIVYQSHNPTFFSYDIHANLAPIEFEA